MGEPGWIRGPVAWSESMMMVLPLLCSFFFQWRGCRRLPCFRRSRRHGVAIRPYRRLRRVGVWRGYEIVPLSYPVVVPELILDRIEQHSAPSVLRVRCGPIPNKFMAIGHQTAGNQRDVSRVERVAEQGHAQRPLGTAPRRIRFSRRFSRSTSIAFLYPKSTQKRSPMRSRRSIAERITNGIGWRRLITSALRTRPSTLEPPARNRASRPWRTASASVSAPASSWSRINCTIDGIQLQGGIKHEGHRFPDGPVLPQFKRMVAISASFCGTVQFITFYSGQQPRWLSFPGYALTTKPGTEHARRLRVPLLRLHRFHPVHGGIFCGPRHQPARCPSQLRSRSLPGTS